MTMHHLPAQHPMRTQHLLSAAFILIAISAYPTSASSQNDPKSVVECPAAADTDHRHLQGRWLAELQDEAGEPRSTATLVLGPHPELAQSVRGTAQRHGATVLVSGDVDDGDLTLEESMDGVHISATWTGQVVDGRCGKEIRGTWNNAHPTLSAPSGLFVLRKQADTP